jgi:hypothetical protein
VEQVRGITLDEYLHATCPDARDLVLWIDVEGAALEVLQGAVQSLSRTNLVFVEVEESHVYEGTHLRREVVSFLDAQGFRELLYRPHRGNAVGDALFVSRSAYDRLDLGSAIRRFGLRFPFLAGWLKLKQISFRILSRVPFFLRLWRWVKPADQAAR